MKKTLFLLLLLPSVLFSQTGQIINGGFEDWTEKDSTVQLLTWRYPVIIKSALVTRISGYHQNHACRIQTIQNTNLDTISSYLAFGDYSSGSFRPASYTSFVDSMVFWARWDMAPGDTGLVQVIQQINGNPTPVGHNYYYSGTQSNWTRIAMKMISPAQDSLKILFHTRGYGTAAIPTPGSYLEIDNVHFVRNGSTPDPLPNYSFEDWYVNKYSDPDGFYSLNQVLNNIGRVPNTNRTTDAYAGNYAALLTVDTISPVTGVLTNAIYLDWQLESGIPYTAMPDSFSGFYKAEVMNNDSSLCQLYFSRNDTIIYYWHKWIDSTVDWTPINLSINLPSRPDSMRLYCRSSTVIGSKLYLDEFQFHGGDLGLLEVDLSVGLYPNPVKNWVTISTSQNIQDLELFNAEGKSVLHFSPKSNLIQLDWSTLPSGTYFLNLRAKSGNKTLQVIKD